MDQSEFVGRVAEIATSLGRFEGKEYDKYFVSLYDEKPTADDYLYEQWVTGGQGGGSCWGDDADRPVEPEPEPEFADLDAILETICPNITFLQYKSVVASVVRRGDRSVREYYGNYTDYGVKTVRLGDLYEKLREKGLLP
jgi:hypothetical protein